MTAFQKRVRVLTQGWKACVRAGLAITPGQFLVLCDIIAHPEPDSARRRSKRLRLSQPLVSGAQRALERLGLIRLAMPIVWRAPGIRMVVYAKATTAALKLFGMRQPRNTHEHDQL